MTFDKGRTVDSADGLHNADHPKYGLHAFNTSVQYDDPEGGPVFTDTDLGYRADVLSAPDPSVVRGFWQSEKYFLPISDQLRQELTLRESVPREVQSLASRMLGTNSVAVHVRRGDYMTPDNLAFRGIMPPEYYERGLSYIASRTGAMKIFIFSDDVEWCRQNLIGQIASTGNSFHDMWLMGRCRHAVIANSTFSWWAAWLAEAKQGRIVVAPRSGLLPRSSTPEQSFLQNG